MLEYIRDPAWQFVGALIAFLAIAAAFVIFVLQRQRKRLAYDLVSRNQLLTVKEELENKLQVLYDGQPTKDICLLVIKIINSGNVAISSSDYERQLAIETGESSKILSAAVTEVDPDGLDVELTEHGSSVELSRTLLNPRDSITLKILVSDFCGKISVDGRIIGVRKITSVSNANGRHLLLLIAGMVGAFVGLLLVIRASPHPSSTYPMPMEGKIGVALIVFSYLIVFYDTAKNRSFRNGLRRLAGIISGIKPF